MLHSQLNNQKTNQEMSNIIAHLAEINIEKERDEASEANKKTQQQPEDSSSKKSEKRNVFCCKQTLFYKPRKTDHEDLFNTFLNFENNSQVLETRDNQRGLQIVKKKDFGSIEEKRYFALPNFEEMSESDFQEEGYKRLNSFKNIKCDTHNYFFELNAYRKGLAISHHHKSTVDGSCYNRESSKIDLVPGVDKGIWNRGL